MYKPICPKCKNQDIGEIISWVEFDANSQGSVHEWLCQDCAYSWEKDELKNELNIYNQLTFKDTSSDENYFQIWRKNTFLFCFYIICLILSFYIYIY